MSNSMFIFLNTPLKKDILPLGSFVLDPLCPTENQCDSTVTLQEGKDYFVSVDSNFWTQFSTESQFTLKIALSKLFGLFWEVGNNKIFEVEADEACLYKLLRPQVLFKQLCSQRLVQEWLEEIKSYGRSAYFIIGYRTLTNAKISRKGQEVNNISPSTQTETDVLAQHKSTRASTKDVSFVAEKERIFAVCYREVRLDISQEPGASSLGSADRWELWTNLRNNDSCSKFFCYASLDNYDLKGNEDTITTILTTLTGDFSLVLYP